MSNISTHEPETKASNKIRDVQDAVIRALNDGLKNPTEIAEEIFDWFFIDAPRPVQQEGLQYMVSRILPTVVYKAGRASGVDVQRAAPTADATTSEAAPARPIRSRVLSPAEEQKVREEIRAKFHKQWLDVVLPMTGSQVRAAKMLPDEIAARIGDDQRVGEVFSADELRATQA